MRANQSELESLFASSMYVYILGHVTHLAWLILCKKGTLNL